jgi:isoleucyl-tRNA synthetase
MAKFFQKWIKEVFSEDFDIINEDIIVQIKGAKDEEAFFSHNVIVSINTKIDDDLKTEGLVREVIRHIQIMRKEANFDVDDRIILSNNFSDDIMNAIEKHKQYFMNEILCTDIVDKLENSDYNSVFSYEKNNFNIFIKKQKNR